MITTKFLILFLSRTRSDPFIRAGILGDYSIFKTHLKVAANLFF